MTDEREEIRRALVAKIVRCAAELAGAQEELKLKQHDAQPTHVHTAPSPAPLQSRWTGLPGGAPHYCIGALCPLCYPQRIFRDPPRPAFPGDGHWDHNQITCEKPGP